MSSTNSTSRTFEFAIGTKAIVCMAIVEDLRKDDRASQIEWKEKVLPQITAVMEEVAFVHGLLSRTDLEISSAHGPS